MCHHQLPSVGPDPLAASHPQRWSAVATAVVGIAALAAGGLFLPIVIAQLGVFPTLFLGMVIAASVGLQLSELALPHHPQP